MVDLYVRNAVENLVTPKASLLRKAFNVLSYETLRGIGIMNLERETESDHRELSKLYSVWNAVAIALGACVLLFCIKFAIFVIL